MAVETLTRMTCDRCKRVVEESDSLSDTKLDERKALLYIEHMGSPPVRFDDLCKKCDERVSSLLSQIRLDEEPAKKAPAEKKEASAEKKAKKSKNKAAEEDSESMSFD